MWVATRLLWVVTWQVCRRRWEVVTWRAGAALLASLGGGDVASVGGFIGVVGRLVGVVGGRVTWRRGVVGGVVGGRWERRAHPGLAQKWAVTGVLDGGGAGRA